MNIYELNRTRKIIIYQEWLTEKNKIKIKKIKETNLVKMGLILSLWY